jgi:hypothetical protein
MDESTFWEIIESAKSAANGSHQSQLDELERLLSTREPAELVAFDALFEGLHRRAYTWELWGAAYVINGGCSDDSFADFRSWLISRGRERYEKSLRDPDSLAELESDAEVGDGYFFEEFAYVASRVYERETDGMLPIDVRPFPRQPSGEEWQEDSQELARLYPRLSAKFAG